MATSLTANLAYCAGYAFYQLLDDGIANFLGLETLRHGTNPLNYIRIRIFGGDPEQGGKIWTLQKGTCRGYFFMVKDSEYDRIDIEGKKSAASNALAKRAIPALYSYHAGASLVRGTILERAGTERFSLEVMKGMIAGFYTLMITPTLRFRFAKIDPARLENDPAHGGGAYRTEQKVEAWRIGIFGSLITGINFGWFTRAKEKPMKVLTGIVQLVAAACIGYLAKRYLFDQTQNIIVAGTAALLA